MLKSHIHTHTHPYTHTVSPLDARRPDFAASIDWDIYTADVCVRLATSSKYPRQRLPSRNALLGKYRRGRAHLELTEFFHRCRNFYRSSNTSGTHL